MSDDDKPKDAEKKTIVPSIPGLSWFEKLIPARIGTRNDDKGAVPEGLWIKCDNCSNVLYHAELERAQDVCIKCGHHMLIGARKRINKLLDPGENEEIGADFNFMAGSMGSVVGERFSRGCERALEQGIPFICFSASGGARMQEALFSLLQMGKTSSLLRRLADRGQPYISVLTDPTMGGVSASLAMLGDIIIAEPGARIGFAGPRVIEQTVREKLPEGFQSSEFLLDHGAIDMICDRREMRDTLARLLAKLGDKPVLKYDESRAAVAEK